MVGDGGGWWGMVKDGGGRLGTPGGESDDVSRSINESFGGIRVQLQLVPE